MYYILKSTYLYHSREFFLIIIFLKNCKNYAAFLDQQHYLSETHITVLLTFVNVDQIIMYVSGRQCHQSEDEPVSCTQCNQKVPGLSLYTILKKKAKNVICMLDYSIIYLIQRNNYTKTTFTSCVMPASIASIRLQRCYFMEDLTLENRKQSVSAR